MGNEPKGGKGRASDDRRSRLAAQLRANLQRRKAQARARRAGSGQGQGGVQAQTRPEATEE
jgi:hypothetical protein